MRANCVLRQTRSQDDGNNARRDVSNPCRQRELLRQASASPKNEEYAACDAIDLSRHEPMQRDRGDQPRGTIRSPQRNGGDSEGGQQTEQYGRHRGRVLYGRQIGICRAEILSDNLPSDEHRR